MSLPLPQRLHPSHIFLLLVILSFLLRLSLISQGPYHVDCLMIALKAQETFETGHLSYALGFGYPLVVLLATVFVAVFHAAGVADPVIAFNFMSVVFGSFAVGMLYLFVRRLLGETEAILAAILFSTSPIILSTSVYGMNHAPAVCFLLATLYFLLGHLKSGRMSDFVMGGIFLGCMGSSRTQDMVLAVPAIMVLFWTYQSLNWKQKLLHLTAFFFVAGFVMALLHLPFLLAAPAGYSGQVKEYWLYGLIKNFGGVFSRFLPRNLGHLVANFAWPGLITAIVGIILLARKNFNAALFLLVWFLVPFLFLGNLLMSIPRFFVVFIPAVVIAQAYALAIVFGLERPKRWFAGIFFLSLIMGQLLSILPGLILRHQSSKVVEFAQWTATVTEKNSKIIAGDEGPFIEHYGKRTVITPPNCLLECPADVLQGFKKVVDEAMAQGPVYITGIGLSSTSVNDDFIDFMAKNYRIKYLDQHVFEDWHHDCFLVGIFDVYMMRVTPRTAS